MPADKASKAGVWKLEADLQPVAELPSQEVPFRQMLWATAEQDRLASVEGSGLRLWSLQGSQVQVQAFRLSQARSQTRQLWEAAWLRPR